MIHQLLKRLTTGINKNNEELVISEEVRETSKELLKTILSHAHMSSTINMNNETADIIYLDIQNHDQASYIIGKDGQTLIALQTIIKAQLFKQYQTYIPIFIDCNNYMTKKIEKAQEKAQEAENLLSAENPMMELFPMSAIERKAIHTLYQDNETIETSSIGSGNDRRITLTRLK